MLTELSVRNLALIEALVIVFGPGVNLLTGETGAGKSILVGALGLLMGRRGAADLVRAGAEEAEVSAFFELRNPDDFIPSFESLGLPPAGEIILRRVVTAAGRSRAYINGSPAPLTQLAALAEELLSISGQHEQQSLLRPASQLEYLDRFGLHRPLLTEMSQAWRRLSQATTELKVLSDRLGQAAEKRDLYEFQRDEIKNIDPQSGEDDELLAEKNRIKNYGRLRESLTSATELLSGEPGNVVEKLGRIRRFLETAAALEPGLAETLTTTLDCYHRLADLAVELERRDQDLNAEPDRLEWVDERLNTLAKLKRKYNLPLAGIIAHGQRLSELLDELDGAGLDLARLKRDQAQALAAALALAARLHQARITAGQSLAGLLTASLKSLGFPKIEIQVRVEGPAENSPEEAEKRLGAGGYDRVELLFSPNPGEGLKPLARIASGGELSRVMLALKTALERPGDQLLVFDEIDAGLGGATAEAVAAQISRLAARQQLIVITHLPQMAALGGRHFVVAKTQLPGGDRTVTTITPLEESARVEELARMLSGASPSREALALAERLLEGGRAILL